MPYITGEERRELDPAIDMLVEKLRQAPVEKVDGRLNYVISRLPGPALPEGLLPLQQGHGGSRLSYAGVLQETGRAIRGREDL
jgi:hypothetical protein